MRQTLLLIVCAALATGCGSKAVEETPEKQNLENQSKDTVCINSGQSTKYDPVDMLFVIDDSFSMDEEQARLAAAADEFVVALADLSNNPNLVAQPDYHIGVTTMDTALYWPDGTPLSPDGLDGALYRDTFVDPSTPNPAEVLDSILQPGAMGSTYETGLENALRAIDPNYVHNAPGGANYGFFREEAKLVLIFVSDENDNITVTPYTEFHKDPEEYAADFDIIKGPGNYKAYSVIHTPNENLDPKPVAPATTNECFDTAADAVGHGYKNFSDLSNGSIESLCNWDGANINGPDYVQFLQEIVNENFTPIDFFALPEGTLPIPSTLEVSVNDEVVASDQYSYNAEDNAIVAVSGSVLTESSSTNIEICFRDAKFGEN